VRRMQQTVERELERTVQTQHLVGQGLLLWHSAVLEGAVLAEVQRTLADYKGRRNFKPSRVCYHGKTT